VVNNSLHRPGRPGTPGLPGETKAGGKLLSLVRKAGPFVPVVGSELLLAEGARAFLPNHNLKTRGGASIRRDAAGSVPFVQDPFHRPQPVHVTVQPTAINLNNRQLARIHYRMIADENARRR
jgi:hypothetical protein